MIPKDKAKDLINKFGEELALKVVDEIIDALETYDELTGEYLKDEFGLEYFSAELQNMDSDFRYWNKVKQELNISEPKHFWWGYKHVSGTYQAKRYFDERDVQDALDSSFCELVVHKFEASSREEALEYIKQQTS